MRLSAEWFLYNTTQEPAIYVRMFLWLAFGVHVSPGRLFGTQARMQAAFKGHRNWLALAVNGTGGVEGLSG